jgi:prolyl-tRNA synthetase
MEISSFYFQVRIVRRDNGAKADIPSTDLVEHVRMLLDEIQDSLFETAKQKRDACIKVIHTWDEFTTALNEKKLILAPWCDEEVFEVAYSPPKLNFFPATINL